MKEPVVEPPQEVRTGWKSGGWPGWQCAATPYNREGQPRRRGAPGATVTCCGIAVDRPAGEKLGTDPVNRSVVNVGTVLSAPTCRPSGSAAARHVVC